MAGPDTSRPPKIFLSYAGEDSNWVKWFTHEDWFGSKLGNVIVEKYDQVGNRLDFGPLRNWLDQQINEATVVIAFVSRFYQQKQWTGVEWNKALNEFHRRRLIFVPVMLDADAKGWWKNLQQQAALPDDYIYSDFTDGNGQRVMIDNNQKAQTQIEKLAERIKLLLTVPLKPEVPDHPETTAGPGGADVVVLGHPTSRSADDVAAQASALEEAAEGEALRVQKWNDTWERNSAARGQAGVAAGTPAVFVQPLPAGEASDQLADVGRTAKRLSNAGVSNAAVVLWLPNGDSDADFKAAAAAPTESLPDLSALRLKPALRVDTPQQLSRQLRAIIPASPAPTGPVLQIETVGSTNGNPNLEAKRLSIKLSQMFGDIVNGVVATESPPWEFWAEQFKAQIAQISGSRAIVAVHDLDVTTTAGAVATRQSIEKKFQQMHEYVSQTDCAGKLKFFWAALLYNNASALPFARYPSGRFNQWRLLSFEPNDDPAGPPVRPAPASLGVFRAELCEWATG
jgi:TIR domain